MNKTYLDFEGEFTETVRDMFFSEGEPQTKEMLRLELLRQRVFAKHYWEKIGKEIPAELNFDSFDDDVTF